MAGVWNDVATAALCGRLGDKLCTALKTRQSTFQAPPGGMYGGWHQYLSKDLRTLAGAKVRGKYNVRYCGKGKVGACAKDLWAAIDKSAAREAQRQGSTDPSTWKRPVVKVELHADPALGHAVHEPPERHPPDLPVRAVSGGRGLAVVSRRR